MWKLVIEDDEGKRTVVPLTREQYSIGRKDGNTIRLTERNVSREHARLLKRGATNGSGNGAAHAAATATNGEKASFVLEDLTSYNGVFVNGLRISHSQDLAHGDLVQIGDYRIVLQDEALVELPPGPPPDSKATLPQAPNARAASLLDRPNRFVLLAGPTPGTEYPLVEERMTIGRAEDASISINHNSVSRLHCEVHALGDGRFEIVDKGSSNGVRVNGADLRRGIVEPGDVIELGDVKFKFIGAGQIFRPTESQQLALLGDREANEVVREKRTNMLVPAAIFAGVVLLGAVAAVAYSRAGRSEGPTSASSVAAESPDQATLDDAVKKCAAGDCDAAHDELAPIAPSSPVRATPDFKDVENRWADHALVKADTESDNGKRRLLYQHVSQDAAVDQAKRTLAANKLQALDSVATIPTTAVAALPPVAPPSADSTPAPKPEQTPPRTAMVDQPPVTAYPTTPAATPTPSPPTPPPVATPPAPPPKPLTGDDRDRQEALNATTQDAKATMKKQLENKVYAGRGSDTDIRLLIATCKELGDKQCVQQVRQIQAQRSQGQ